MDNIIPLTAYERQRAIENQKAHLKALEQELWLGSKQGMMPGEEMMRKDEEIGAMRETIRQLVMMNGGGGLLPPPPLLLRRKKK